MKLEDITREVVHNVVALCPDCGFTDASIDQESFSCYPNSPSYVTYRARLEGTSLTDSDHFISLIEQWVKGGASVIVSGVLMKVDGRCSVEISNLSEEECIVKPVNTTTNNPDSQNGAPLSITIVAVVVVVVVLIIAITTAAVIITVVFLKSHRGKHSFKDSSKVYVTVFANQKYILFLYRNGAEETNEDDMKTSSNEAYKETKHRVESGEAYEMTYVTAIACSPTLHTLLIWR